MVVSLHRGMSMITIHQKTLLRLAKVAILVVLFRITRKNFGAADIVIR